MPRHTHKVGTIYKDISTFSRIPISTFRQTRVEAAAAGAGRVPGDQPGPAPAAGGHEAGGAAPDRARPRGEDAGRGRAEAAAADRGADQEPALLLRPVPAQAGLPR